MRIDVFVRLASNYPYYFGIFNFFFILEVISDFLGFFAFFFPALTKVSNLFVIIYLIFPSWEEFFFFFTSTQFITFFITFGLGALSCITLFTYFAMSFLGLYGVYITGLIALLIAFFSLMACFPAVILYNTVTVTTLFKWFMLSPASYVTFTLLIDHISYSFASLTIVIAVFVYVYAFSYFRFEPNIDRLLILLNSFVAGMLLLVFAGNLIVLFLGWELIGLTSFLLINFWSTRIGTLKSAFKAFTFNKFSDVFFFTAIISSLVLFNSIDISTILASLTQSSEMRYHNIVNSNFFYTFTCSLLWASFIKSAQFGYHLWLPDSMEAPVPASALIHSATLVSAGVYVTLRFYPVFQHISMFNLGVPLLGLLTACYGGLVAYFQFDLKRVLAYSTISHCGFLLALASFGAIDYTLLYLAVHGFFKALAFLCVGNILRFAAGYQDLRRMGQFWKYLPFECFVLILILFNLSGLPFFFGFYIKHLVVAYAFIPGWFLLILSPLASIAAVTGLLYTFKIFYYVFFDFKKARYSIYLDSSLDEADRRYATNATLGVIYSISLLVITSYCILLILFYQKLSYALPMPDNFNFIWQSSLPALTITDTATIINGAIINWVILIFISLLAFIKWDSSVSNDMLPLRCLCLCLVVISAGALFHCYL